MKTCFISYSWDSDSHKKWIDHFASYLNHAGIQVIYDRDRKKNKPGDDISEFIGKGIKDADFIVIVCTVDYVIKANSVNNYVGYETAIIRERLRNEPADFRIFPILRAGTDMPSYLHDRNYFDMSDDAQFIGQITRLLLEMGGLRDGMAPKEIVFGKVDLPGQVFAVELLSEPVWLIKNGDQITIRLSRDKVDLALFTHDGRRKLVSKTFSGKKAKKSMQELDQSIHRFLLHKTEELRLCVDQRNLRWASGGILARVKYRGRLWVPFFFRDIPPYGWNICLGASEASDNINEPWSFIMREFLEETLVCQNTSQHNMKVIKRPFVFHHIEVKAEMERAEKFSRKHQHLRFERDGMAFVKGEPIYVNLWNTQTDLEIERENEPLLTEKNVLVCLNISELGIEILKIISYDLDDSDYILDGEIYDPGGSQQVELVRMPVALISLDFLQEAFKGKEFLDFYYEDPKLPSILTSSIPPEHIHIFEHDVRRQRDLALGKDPKATEWEEKRSKRWYKQFGKNFLDAVGNPTNTNANRLFTPTSAKALSYYFANEEIK